MAVANVKAFDEQNPPGRVGVEVLGKGVWYRAPSLSGSCLQQKAWAFNNDPRRTRDAVGRAMPRISPTYSAQNAWVDVTEQGYCVYVGNDATLEILQTTFIDSTYRVEVKLGMAGPGGWWECIDPNVKTQTISVVETASGDLEIKDGSVSVGRGACRAPLPLGESRKPEARPRKHPPALPTRKEVREVLQAFDDRLRDHDYVGALEQVACFNLFEESKFGSCSVGEIVGLSAVPEKDDDPFEPPWTDGVFYDLDSFGRISKDVHDPNMVHVEVQHRRTQHRRTLSLYWMEDGWALVGVVSLKGEGLTSMRFLYDLDRRDRRDIFERRLDGEMIDELGFPYNPLAEEG